MQAHRHAEDVQTYRGLFAVAEFRALWFSTALTTAASTMAGLALGVLVHDQTGSALLSATVMFGPSVMQVLGASTLMSAADASPPRRTLVLVGLVVIVTTAAQALLPLPMTGRLLIAFAVSYAVSLGSGVRSGSSPRSFPRRRTPWRGRR